METESKRSVFASWNGI